MSDENTTAEVETTTVTTDLPATNGTPKAPKAKASKPAPKKAAVKKVAKPAPKAAPKAAPKSKAAPTKTSTDLRKPQIRILACLSKNSKPLSRAAIAEKAPVDVASCVEYLGSHDKETRLANDKKHFPSLVTRGYVSHEEIDQDGRDVVVYSITAKGRDAYAKAKAAV